MTNIINSIYKSYVRYKRLRTVDDSLILYTTDGVNDKTFNSDIHYPTNISSILVGDTSIKSTGNDPTSVLGISIIPIDNAFTIDINFSLEDHEPPGYLLTTDEPMGLSIYVGVSIIQINFNDEIYKYKFSPTRLENIRFTFTYDGDSTLRLYINSNIIQTWFTCVDQFSYPIIYLCNSIYYSMPFIGTINYVKIFNECKDKKWIEI